MLLKQVTVAIEEHGAIGDGPIANARLMLLSTEVGARANGATLQRKDQGVAVRCCCCCIAAVAQFPWSDSTGAVNAPCHVALYLQQPGFGKFPIWFEVRVSLLKVTFTNKVAGY